MKVYQVVHCYDVDGGFGDAVREKEVISGFERREDAEAFVEKIENPHVYDTPYCELRCGIMDVEPVEIISHKDFNLADFDLSDYWWRPECKGYDDPWYDPNEKIWDEQDEDDGWPE